jgi:hypothetical protein
MALDNSSFSAYGRDTDFALYSLSVMQRFAYGYICSLHLKFILNAFWNAKIIKKMSHRHLHNMCVFLDKASMCIGIKSEFSLLFRF